MTKKLITEDISALDLICNMHQGISKQKAKKIIKYSTFLRDGKAVKTLPSSIFRPHQSIEILRDTVTKFETRHPDKIRPIVIKFEDEHLIVAIKPVGLLSCKSRDQRGRSYDQMLKEYISKREGKKTDLWIAHRIDREVEGLIIFAKSEEIQQKIKDNWKKVTKKYLALTEGSPSEKAGFIEGWLKEGFRHKMNVYKNEIEDSIFAKTQYRVKKQIGDYTLIEVTLHTGRKNQIRAHLSSIGCPIVGDYTYGADSKIVRQVRLVAYYLDFHHPILDKQIRLEFQPKARFFKPSKDKDESYK